MHQNEHYTVITGTSEQYNKGNTYIYLHFSLFSLTLILLQSMRGVGINEWLHKFQIASLPNRSKIVELVYLIKYYLFKNSER